MFKKSLEAEAAAGKKEPVIERSIPSRVTSSLNQVDLTVGIVFLRESGKIEEVRPGRQRSETLSTVETSIKLNTAL